MATRRYYSSNAVDNTVSSAINSSASTVVLSTSPIGYPGTTPFVVALDYNSASEELVLVTNVSASTLNITRGYGGTSATGHNAGAVVRHVIIAQDLTDFQEHAAAIASGTLGGTVHGVTGAIISGVTGAIVGTADTQTLINKTIDYTKNTMLNLPTNSGPTGPTGATGSAGNTGPTGAIATLTLNAQTGTTYTLVSGDLNKLVTLSNSGAITLTIPSAVFTTGQEINIQQIGAGQVTVQGDGTSTFTGTGTKLRAQYSAATIVCTGTNTFTLIGDLA